MSGDKPQNKVHQPEFSRKMEGWYAQRMGAHGANPVGVGYKSPEAQRNRFVQLAKVLPPQPADFSLNDYGCGLGGFAHFLASEGQAPAKYFGFDSNPTMVRLAIDASADRRRWHFSADPTQLRPADYSVASGLMNLKFDVPEDEWRDHVCDLIDALAEVSRRGFAFNILTRYSDGDRMEPELFYADPTYFFDRCMRRYSRSVALLHDYGEYEFTIIVRTP